ncbi:hypothetical protein ACFTWF_22945 [Rhodococcus sp. NPDC056960]|uniref:hypothetical protein n=1 Tax=Rhodococcus sp. NPDC056960 TaxID=3345982 RepID=UPI003644864D
MSSTGHGSFRAASLPGPSRRGTVPAHLFAYQLEHGIIPDWGGPAPTTRCCATSATSPAASTLRTCGWAPTESTAANTTCGGTRAIAAAIRTGLANHDDPGTMEDRIRAAENAGLPLTLW